MADEQSVATVETEEPKRRCQTGRVRPVLVEAFEPPVKLFVRTTVGRLEDLSTEMHAVPDDDQILMLPVVRRFLQEALVGWEGVEDAETGQPRPYTKEAILDFDLEDMMILLDAIQNIGEAGSGDPLAATTSAATSAVPPAS